MHYFIQEASEILKHALKWVRNKKKGLFLEIFPYNTLLYYGCIFRYEYIQAVDFFSIMAIPESTEYINKYLVKNTWTKTYTLSKRSKK